MTTITIHRDAPVSTFPPNTTVTISHLPKTWSWSDIVEMMPTSLSGEKGDYDWEYNESTATLSIASKHSYQQRFHSKQVELATLEDNFEKKVLSDEYLADVLMKVQLYTSLGRGVSLNQDQMLTFIYSQHWQYSMIPGSGNFLGISEVVYTRPSSLTVCSPFVCSWFIC